MLTPDKTNERFITILSDGKFHEKVDEGTEGAILREYETSSGEKGEKWELIYKKVEGIITNVDFHEGDFGENILITFKLEDDTEITLAQGVTSNFGEDILKKIPALNFSEKVGMQPYVFTKDNGKEARGVTVWQTSDKVLSYFRDFEKNEDKNGIPQPEGDTEKYDKDDWRIHFIKVRKFLVSYAKEHIVPKFAKEEGAIERPSDEDEQRELAASIPF